MLTGALQWRKIIISQLKPKIPMRKHQEKQEGNMKKILSIVLAVLLIAALGTTAFADDPVSPKTQLQLMAALIDSLKQDDSTRTWYYCVTDLDHDGCLEFLAASLHPVDRSTNLKVWIVSPDGKTLNNAQLVKDSADESFPDIMPTPLTPTMSRIRTRGTTWSTTIWSFRTLKSIPSKPRST